MSVEAVTIIAQTTVISILSITLALADIPTKIATLTSEISIIAVGLASATFALGVLFMYNPVVTVFPNLGEHGQRLKMSALKALFEIGIFGGLASLISWIVALLATACEPSCATANFMLP